MVGKNRKIYSVNEEILKQVVAGDTSSVMDMRLENTDGVVQKEKADVPPNNSGEVISHDEHTAFDDYRERFLNERLTGTRRQTYIHDSLYRMISEVLPVIAPQMSVPTFVNNILSEHLRQYEDIINGIYNENAIKKPLRWKK